MGFKKPKTSKSNRDPLENDTTERDLDPSGKVLSGGGKVAKKRGNSSTNDAPKAFQHIMRFMEMKQANDKTKLEVKRKQQKQKQKKNSDGPKEVTESLTIMPGENMYEFNKRVKEKLANNLQAIGTKQQGPKDTVNLNPSRDDGGHQEVSKRSERKKRNDAVRKQRKQTRKARKNGEDPDVFVDNSKESSQVKQLPIPVPAAAVAAAAPKFGEQAQAPPIFKSLPKQTFKKIVPLPESKEETVEKKRREDMAVKNMIQRTSRLSPLERMQAKRKAKLEVSKNNDTAAAEKRIMEAERERAIRRYRMLKAARESTTAAASNK